MESKRHNGETERGDVERGGRGDIKKWETENSDIEEEIVKRRHKEETGREER